MLAKLYFIVFVAGQIVWMSWWKQCCCEFAVYLCYCKYSVYSSA